ncbi:GntR family transcriptional regulator [Jidongwangia harbinensis]|uniref:GntR family transcriptional regulator n=1 Tax=Jidongwangia harbinensis TaxID=2878561 RepID=UPI001CD9697D|nr:GntR family transcriptional regulator [Jidongwangia harbinensis]MCA2219273.1 GntR family transcriptional regulator [Jidongwangia harbinensis]
MITFRVDRRSGTAVYAQLVQQVRQAVRVGRLAPGDRLPTAREVAERTGINPNTVLRAYRDLETAGLVEPRQGSGTFVRPSLPQPQVDVTALRQELAGWIGRARAAGLDLPDIQALVTDVAADQEESHTHAR